METYFESFQDDQYSANAFLSNVDEDMKDQLDVLESIKLEDSKWKDEFKKPSYLTGKEDVHQIMSDWQQHVKLFQSSDAEDLGLGLDSNLDILNTYPENNFYEEKESPILSKALKCPSKQNNIINIEQCSKLLGDLTKEVFPQNIASTKLPNSSQRVLGLIKTEPNLIRKVTLLNGEKEILGKNIIGLHSLNEIKENPDENCQVTSTVINGKKYKIIIKPKSLKVKKLSEEKIRKTLIKKLFKCNLVTRAEPKEDEIISEMRNGNYDVPILGSDILPSWDLVNLDSDWKNQMEEDLAPAVEPMKEEPIKKVPPLKIKLPKPKKHKKKKTVNKSDEEVDVETVNDKSVDGDNLTNLLENFENFESEVTKLQNKESNSLKIKENKKEKEKAENGKNHLTTEVIEKIEALKRKKDHRITLIQAMPTKKVTKGCTRMQDAVATMNRNKLLKIVSGGDTVQLDHDYCSSFIFNSLSTKDGKKVSCLEEKNPKKDSGMESGDVSDASEGPYTPENSQAQRLLNNFINKNIENGRIDSNREKEVKAPVEFYQASNSTILKLNVSNTDLVKTKTASHGNKALTNSMSISIDNSDSGNSVPSANRNISEMQVEGRCKNDEKSQGEDNCSLSNPEPVQNERPKRKLKLEEYLSRRNIKEKEKLSSFSKDSAISNSTNDSLQMNKSNPIASQSEVVESKENESNIETNKFKKKGSKDKVENSKGKEKIGKKYWRGRSRSSSNSSGERRQNQRSKSRSRSKSCWRSDSSGSHTKRPEARGKYKSRHSESRDRKRDTWSSSLSRSPSRESSTSSDYCDSKRYKHSPTRYRRRSRSRSASRIRAASRNRYYYNRRHPSNYYYNRNLNNKRSKSPFYSCSMREKQRQIEERRVIYVGRIEEGMTNAKLRERFSIFGPIIDISLHFREYGDNYGFVTYAFKADAYDAVEHGNDDPSLPRYDLCFGGRRGFCKEKYADLDGMPTSYSGFNDAPVIHNSNESFDLLLKEAQAKLKIRKKQ